MSYNDSIIVERLRKEYGEDFCYIVEPWNLEGYQQKVYPEYLPNTIYSNNYGESVSIGTIPENWNESQDLEFFGIASNSSDDVGYTIQVIGINQIGELDFEQVITNGSNVVSTTLKYKDIYSIEIIGMSNKAYPAGDISIGRLNDYVAVGFFNNTSMAIINGTLKSRAAKYMVPSDRDLYITKFRISGPRCKDKMSEWSMHKSYIIEQGETGEHVMTDPILNGFLDDNGKEEIIFEQPYLIPSRSLVFFNLENLEKSAAERSISVFAEGFTVLIGENKFNKMNKNGYSR